MIRSTYGSRGIARYRYEQARRIHGDDHPATRAQLGRLRALLGWVPQRGSTTPEAVAWYRETGAAPGYCNRAERRAA